MPARKKSPENLVDRRQARLPRVVALQRPTPAPDLPAGLLAVTRDRWIAFWQSPLAALVEPATDLPALERLFGLYDERERAMRAFRRRRIVPGSQGQPVVSPQARVIAMCDREIRQLEQAFGLTPLARLRLGVAFGQAQRTLDDLAAETGSNVTASRARDPRVRAAR